jgi:hypothetical protein
LGYRNNEMSRRERESKARSQSKADRTRLEFWPLDRLVSACKTRGAFLERRRFELFSRNQRNQTAERKLLARKSNVLKALDWVLWAFAGAARRPVEHLFSTHVVGGGQKSGIFRAGPRGNPARIAAKFRKIFLLVSCKRGQRLTLKKCREIQGGGG